MNKLQMAHEWAMKHGNAETIGSRQNMIKYAWEYADAMQAEADKREKEEAEKKRKEMRELLSANNTFIEKEGQHFDDVEWQPNWSQAPDWANWWAVDENLKATWFVNEPHISVSEWNTRGMDVDFKYSPLFGYTGNWRDSIRKRPK